MKHLKVYAGPSRYVQGPGAFSQLGQEIIGIGLKGKALVIASPHAEKVSRPMWEPSMQKAGIEFCFLPFSGECTLTQISKVTQEVEKAGADYIVAIGGGKTLDTARAAAEELHLETVICPSIASTDAPCIALSVIYTDEGEMTEFRLHRKNPILVLVDSTVIANAPKRFLVAGMGDALSTYYEARASKATHSLNPRGGHITECGLAISKLCRDILLEDGVEVASTFENTGVSEPFERIVEANTLLSGMGVELCHVAGAHAIHNGLTQLKETHAYYHGEKVAFGLISQLVLEHEKPDEINRLLAFYNQVGLPSTFAQLGLSNPSDDDLFKVAHRSMQKGETMCHEPVQIEPKIIVEAMKEANRLGQAAMARKAA
ncbi:MAG: Glycerol dehydrogenase [Chlamydiia bacterium]|nr:Glycerol dehydrogenase [Chlamydiia bacterium]